MGLGLGLGLGLGGCDVAEPPASTGGVDAPEGPCGRGLVVIHSDYASTSVGLADPAGKALSGSILSSGARPAGLSMPLSGDVVAPGDRVASGDVVLLDRYPNAVITWIDARAGAVRGQLSVATGFASNPQDYVEISPTRAYVTRLSSNPKPGAEPFDEGGDVLVIDPTGPRITGRIGFSEPPPFLPRPARMTRVGEHVWVLLQRLDADFASALDSVIVALDAASGAEAWRHELGGLSNCGAISHDAGQVAVACSGVFAEKGQQLARGGLVVLDASASPPVEILRVAASTFGGPPASSLAFGDRQRLLVPVFGDLDVNRPDRLFQVDLQSGQATVVHEASGAFVLGDVRCSVPCSGRCFVADAGAPGLRPLRLEGGSFVAEGALVIDPRRGLPPRNLGGF